MIRMMGLVNLQAIGTAPVGSRSVYEEELKGDQTKLDVDNDGKIEGEDLAKLRAKKIDEEEYDYQRDMDAMAGRERRRDYYPPLRRPTPHAKPSAGSGAGILGQVVRYKDVDGKDREATVKSLLSYPKEHPGRKIAARMYAQHMATKRQGQLKETVVEENPDNSAAVDDHEGRMAKADLMAIHKHSKEIYNMLGDNEELEGWVQSKITKAAEYMNAVYNNMNYEKNKPGSLGDGEGVPADTTGDMMPEGKHLEPATDHTDPHKDPHLAHESICEGVGCDDMNEVAPEGWEGTVKSMKKYKKIDNPWALAYYMKSKGYKSHKKEK